jgi:hypothetical protein
VRRRGFHIFYIIGSQMAVRLSALSAGRPLPPGRSLIFILWVINYNAMIDAGGSGGVTSPFSTSALDGSEAPVPIGEETVWAPEPVSLWNAISHSVQIQVTVGVQVKWVYLYCTDGMYTLARISNVCTTIGLVIQFYHIAADWELQWNHLQSP